MEEPRGVKRLLGGREQQCLHCGIFDAWRIINNMLFPPTSLYQILVDSDRFPGLSSPPLLFWEAEMWGSGDGSTDVSFGVREPAAELGPKPKGFSASPFTFAVKPPSSTAHCWLTLA